jgi:regulator of protease activity HflC (stomatin/prohibitin superfamily)
LADDRIQSTPVTLHEVTTQDGVALEVHLEVLWRRQAPAQRHGAAPCASLRSCQALIPEAAEAVVRSAFRVSPLADFLRDRQIRGSTMGLALRLALRPQGLWVDTVELQLVRPPTGRQAASDAHACVALRLLRAMRHRVGDSAATALR